MDTTGRPSSTFTRRINFAGTDFAEQLRLAAKPMDAKRLGQSTAIPLCSDWETVKEAVMFRATLAKFEPHADVRAVLLATDDEEFVEESPTDYYWDCGADGSGQNRLRPVQAGGPEDAEQAAGLLRRQGRAGECGGPAGVCTRRTAAIAGR